MVVMDDGFEAPGTSSAVNKLGRVAACRVSYA
jgi:hypothetical protein